MIFVSVRWQSVNPNRSILICTHSTNEAEVLTFSASHAYRQNIEIITETLQSRISVCDKNAHSIPPSAGAVLASGGDERWESHG